MAAEMLTCPICTKPGFQNLDSLCQGLISAATRQLVCPVCNDILCGLDKYTIHLFSHSVQKFNQFSYGHLDSIQDGQTSLINSCPTVCMENMYKNSLSANKLLDERKLTQHTNLVTELKLNPESKHFSSICDCQEEICEHHNNSEPLNFSFANGIQEIKETNGCGSEINDKCSRIEHKGNTDKKGISLSCHICGFLFKDESIFNMHMELMHSNENYKGNINPVASVKCERKQNNENMFSCRLCLKSFKMRGSLMVHHRIAHSDSANESIKSLRMKLESSSVPGDKNGYKKSYKKDHSLVQQSKSQETKQWECDVCSKLFTTKYFLKKHKRLHTGEMPYKCEICSKSFTFQQSYHKHLLYHSDEKPHVCTECDRAFKELSTLHNHQRIHTGEKPFACETCGKCFRQRVSYLVHRRIHTGVMPYKCTACGKNFRYKVSQRTHKCCSQPPGTVVRQTGELVQKLLNQVVQMNTNFGSTSCEESKELKSHVINNTDDVSQKLEDKQHAIILGTKNQNILLPLNHVISSSHFVLTDKNSLLTNSATDIKVGTEGITDNASVEKSLPCSDDSWLQNLITNDIIPQPLRKKPFLNVKYIVSDNTRTSSSNPCSGTNLTAAHVNICGKMQDTESFSLQAEMNSLLRIRDYWNSDELSSKTLGSITGHIADTTIETTDFFSLVMSPEVSPSENLKQLSLSDRNDHCNKPMIENVSVTMSNNYEVQESLKTMSKKEQYDCDRRNKVSTEQQVLENPVSGNTVYQVTVPESVEFINDESLKELLYGKNT